LKKGSAKWVSDCGIGIEEPKKKGQKMKEDFLQVVEKVVTKHKTKLIFAGIIVVLLIAEYK
jgi:hypothetical protein